MNENLNLVEILKDCPKGTKFYSTIYGEVEFGGIEKETYLVTLMTKYHNSTYVTSNGKYSIFFDGECTLFPSKDQRDWSKFTTPWLKKERFDPKNLMPFDKVLVRDNNSSCWRCTLYSHQRETKGSNSYRYVTMASSSIYCIPYNDDTKHLVGTNEEAPEYYRYWEE